MPPKREPDDIIFEQAIQQMKSERIILDQFINGDTTPSVLNRRVFKSHSGATTVTDFDDAADQQTIYILGNGNLTASNNANIKTSTGANKVLAANKLYAFTHIEGVWYEHTP